MSGALRRRLDRLADRTAAGRLIVVEVSAESGDDEAPVDGALAAAGVERDAGDLLVQTTRYGGAGPVCAFRSVWPLPPKARGTRR